MKGSYERRYHLDKAVLRDLLARESREHLLPPVNVTAQILPAVAVEGVGPYDGSGPGWCGRETTRVTL